MDCVLVGTSLRQMTSTGCVVRDTHHHTTQVLPLDTVVMVSLLTMLFLEQFVANVLSKKKTTLQKPNLVMCSGFSFLLGFYMYIETSLPRSYGDEAKLLFSPSRSAIGKWSCLKFYYHMYGATINRLDVFNGNSMVFTQSGQQGDTWLYAETTVIVHNTVSSLSNQIWFQHKDESFDAILSSLGSMLSINISTTRTIVNF